MQDTSIPASDDEAKVGVVAKSGRSKFRNILSTVLILLAAPLIALFLTAFVFQSYEVDGQSMVATLQDHDRLIVWKLPRTISRITKHEYIPARGEVVIFVKRGLYEYGGSNQKQLIKRVIGLPGDRVVVRDGHITVYNNEHPEGFNPDSGQDYSSNLPDTTPGNVDLTVGQGQIFVCGDNRVNSLDSRSFGTVPVSDIVGRLALRVFPINTYKSFL